MTVTLKYLSSWLVSDDACANGDQNKTAIVSAATTTEELTASPVSPSGDHYLFFFFAADFFAAGFLAAFFFAFIVVRPSVVNPSWNEPNRFDSVGTPQFGENQTHPQTKIPGDPY